jgi:hypothetical protein
MLTAKIDLWTPHADAKVVPTNGVVKGDGTNVMGIGVALQAAKFWDDLPYNLGQRIQEHGNRVFVFEVPERIRPSVNCGYLVTFPVKGNWRDKARYDLIWESTRQLEEVTTMLGWCDVYLPQVGCGAGGLQWENVESLIGPKLDMRFCVVTRDENGISRQD